MPPEFRFANIGAAYQNGRNAKIEELFKQAQLDQVALDREQAVRAQQERQDALSRIRATGNGAIDSSTLAELAFIDPKAATAIAGNQLKTQEYQFNNEANPYKIQDLRLKPYATQAQITQRQASAESSQASAARQRQGIGLDRAKFDLAQQRFYDDRAMRELDGAIKSGALNKQNAEQLYAAMASVAEVPEERRAEAYEAAQRRLGVPEQSIDPYRPETFASEMKALGTYSGLLKDGNGISVSTVGPDGSEQVIQIGGNKRRTNDIKQHERSAAIYAQRMEDAESTIESVGQTSLFNQATEGSVLANFIKSADGQNFEQAKRNFINAVLRKESGAVISATEFDNAERQYFPRPGDSQAVLAQKKRNRDVAIAGLKSEAGPALDDLQSNLPRQGKTDADNNADPLGIR